MSVMELADPKVPPHVFQSTYKREQQPEFLRETEDGCDAPVDEELQDQDTRFKQTSRVNEDEGAVFKPNVKHSLLNMGHGKMHSFSSYNSSSKKPVIGSTIRTSDLHNLN